MYNFKEIENKWQSYWNVNKSFRALNDSDKEKYYVLVEFPYPSGAGLHVGHVRSYTALDSMARLKRMQGFNVLFPMGWDAFGAPAEKYAIDNHIHPASAVKECIKVFKGQMLSMGFSFDWEREFSTTDPDYYKWTQWQFLKFFEKGMAYKEKKEINWCENCKTGLSNEDSAGGVCERCGSTVVKKEKEQWLLRMKDYAEDLLEGLKDTEFLDRIKLAQINWIGKSVGAEVNFKIDGADDYLTVFTTRSDTLYGVTFMVMSPEHKYLEKYKDKIKNIDEVKKYQDKAKSKSEIERTDLTREKTGVKLDGFFAINPMTGEKVEVWISDYVLTNYGTGAIMAVPAHDERDYAFAKKFGIPIKYVIDGSDETGPYILDGLHINSGIINGLNKEDGISKINDYLVENKIGKPMTTYRLDDWIFSRQRFWGEPIPLIHCDDCGWVSVPEKELPVTLPDTVNYEPTENGESPLANIKDWVNVPCPKCGGPGTRETDTMPNWAGSSWYWLRYMDSKNKNEFASMDAMKYWGQVDYYNGGMEHAARHLLYARFWNQFMYNEGFVPFKEPFLKRVAHGMILGENGEKMSKSRGNVVNPDECVRTYGADALRTYEMFIGDYEKDASWSENGLKGCKRFLDRVYNLKNKLIEGTNYSDDLEILINQTIKKVTDDILTMNYNTAVSALMILVNAYDKKESITRCEYRLLLHLLNPIAPHITEELNEECKLGDAFANSKWPSYNEDKLVFDTINLPVQMNGKLVTALMVPRDIEEGELEKLVMENTKVLSRLESKEIVKKIYIKGRIYNIVVK